MKIQIENGCALEWLKLQADYSADIIYCDPPYALGSEIIIRPDGKPDYKKAVDFMAKWEMPDGAFWEQFYKECNRVLKHGGHLLMFGIDRQLFLFGYYSNLAGFETKQSLYWYTISGFPKASDLSKMIDKSDAVELQHQRRLKFTKWLRSTGITTKQINDCTGTQMASHYLTDASQPAVMTTEHLNAVRHLLKEVPEWVEDECKKRSVESKNFAEREVVGIKKQRANNKENSTAPLNASKDDVESITAPSTDLAKKYDGFKYSIAPLKQVVETIMVFQKPYKSGSCLHDVLAYENGDETVTCGALDIDGNRVGTDGGTKRSHQAEYPKTENGKEDRSKSWARTGHTIETLNEGRFPSQAFVSPETAEILDKQSGVSKGDNRVNKVNHGTNSKNITFTNHKKGDTTPCYSDTGGASKILHKCEFETADFDLFIYEPKVSASERNAGCENLEKKSPKITGDWEYSTKGKALPSGNNHPTLKPIDLNYKIGKLFKTPNPQTVLVPFSGAGSELIGLFKAGFENIKGCELNPEFVEISKARVRHHCTDLFNPNPLEE